MNLSRHHGLAPIRARATRSNPKRTSKPAPKRTTKPTPKPTPKRAPKSAPKRTTKPTPKPKPQAPARRNAATMIDLRAEPPTLELWLNLSAGTDAALWDAIEESDWTPTRPFELGELSERMAAEIRREIADAIGVENLNDLVFPDGSMVNVPEEIELTVLKSEPTPGGLFGTTWEFHTRVRFPEPMRNWPNEETRENPSRRRMRTTIGRGMSSRDTVRDAWAFCRRTGRDAWVVFAVHRSGHRVPMGWRADHAKALDLRDEVARVSLRQDDDLWPPGMEAERAVDVIVVHARDVRR